MLARPVVAMVTGVLIAMLAGPSLTLAQKGGVAAVYASNAEPLDTGLYVTAGQDVAFFTDGTWCIGGTPPDAECGPASGIRPAEPDELPLVLDSAQIGELIGRVRGEDGNFSGWFAIGDGNTWSMPSEGWLEVLFNDQPDSFDDNSGYIKVRAVALSEPYDTGQLDVLERLFDAQNCLTSVNDAYGLNPLVALDVKGFLEGFPKCEKTLLAGVDEWVPIWNNCIATDSRHEICDQLILNWLRQEIDPEGLTEGPPPVQWIEPVDGATVDAKLKLAAWPTPVLVDGQLTDPTDVARVDFTASWTGGSALACKAKAAGSDGRWSCTADLEEVGVPAGSFELSFAVLHTDSSTLAAPDGNQTVTYDRPPTDPMKYLKAGIPKAVRQSCRKRTGVVPPGTVAAVDCEPAAAAIDTISYFLLPPADARSAWQERMDEYGLKAGAKCAKGKAGIESKGRASSVGCYRNELGYANLRLVTSPTCPAVYIGVLGNTTDIATLWKAYDRVAGAGWVDPGLGGHSDAPGCSSAKVSPPGAPRNVTIAINTGDDRNDPITAGMRQACKDAELEIPGPKRRGYPGTCQPAEIRWEPARGVVEWYEVIEVGTRPITDPKAPYGFKLAPYRKVVARIDWSGPLVFYHVTQHGTGLDIGAHYSYRIVAVNKAGRSSAPVKYTWGY